MKHLSKKKTALLLVGLSPLLMAAECNDDTSKPTGQAAAQQTAKQRVNYIPKNDVEGKNYNKRLQLADDPATILWCTTSIGSSPSSPLVTVPIVGKLTSGAKRPFPNEVVREYSESGSYNPELPGADGFYGSSGDYRYGFRPDGVYVEFYGTQTYCTTEPTVFQREKTIIDLGGDSGLKAADLRAQQQLAAGDAKGAQDTLSKAVGK